MDAAAAAKVTTALRRLELGNFSNVKGVGGGVFEYRIDFGPGYRVYFGKYGDAVQSLQSGNALARNVADAPTLINGLVGVSIATQMSDQVETMLQQPDAPNLYWALATLPRPLIDFRRGFDAEFAELYLTYPELRDIDHKELTPDEWRRLLQKVSVDLEKINGYTGNVAGPQERVYVRMLEGYPRAKRALIAEGRSTRRSVRRDDTRNE